MKSIAAYFVGNSLALIMMANVLYAQAPGGRPDTSSSFVGRNFRLSGEIGTYGELYGIDGLAARRPSSTGRLFFRPTITLFDALSINFDFLLSTEGNTAQQNINQLGINPTWSWGQAHIGDFTENYTSYTLSGILIRGGGFFINPGVFRLGAVGGYTKRAVLGTADNGAYDRYLYGGRIGIGSEEGGFFDLLFLRVRDKVSSLSTPSTAIVIDSLNPANTTIQPYEVTPQENLIVGFVTNMKLFDDAVLWNIEGTGSLFTRDMRVNADTTLKLPSFLKKIYRANVTSNVDLAVASDMTVNAGSVNVRAGYKYIGPGYNSLGVASLLNDLQEMSIAPSVRIGNWSVSTSVARQNDNLLKQKLFTLVRYLYGGNIVIQATPQWTTGFIGNFLTMSNNSANDTTKVGFTSLTLGTNQYYIFPEGSFFQNFILNYTYQRSGDNSPLRVNTKSSSHSANAGTTIPLSTTISLTPGVGIVYTKIALVGAQTTQSYSLALQQRMLENTLINVLSGTLSIAASSKSYRTSLSSTYQLTGSLNLGLALSMMNFRNNAAVAGQFDEFTASLNVSQKF